MKATELDYETDCPLCNDDNHPETPDLDLYDGECTACNGTGRVNRYQDADDGKVVIGYHTAEASVRGEEQKLIAAHQMPERDKNGGGFEGRFGDWTPEDTETGSMADYEDDTKERLRNETWTGEYRANNTTVKAENIGPGQDGPADPDLDIEEAIAWKEERADTHRANELKRIKHEQEREGVR